MVMIDNLLGYISWALSLYILVVVVSAIITWVNPDPRNNVVQFLRRVTEPAYARVRSVLPTYFGGIDLAPMILILLIVFIQQVVIASLRVMLAGGPPLILAANLIGFVSSMLSAYMWIVIAAAVVSWISADLYNPIVRGLYSLTEPVFLRVRRILPVNIGGIDLAPLVIIGVILLIQNVVLRGLVGMMIR